MKIYWGITASRSYIKTIPFYEPVIISACGLWNGKRFMNKRLWPWREFVLDSGGFIALNRWGEYPFNPDEYLKLIDKLNPSWAASMDYPCEPDISKGTKLSIDERINATVELACYLIKNDERVIPVLQGYTIPDYEYCWNLLKSKIKIHRIAIGSICKRQSSREISTLCYYFKQFIPDIPVHGFGVKIRALAYPETYSLFSSIDTNAWEFHRRGLTWDGLKLTDRDAFIIYQEKVNKKLSLPRQLCLTKIATGKNDEKVEAKRE